MKPSNVLLAAALLLATSTFARDTTLSVTDRFQKDLPLSIGGSILIENPYGNVTVLGKQGPGVSISAEKVVRAKTQEAIEDGRKGTEVAMGGDQNFRVVKTVLPAARPADWSSIVNYVIRVPHTVHVRVNTNASDRLRVKDIVGNVFVKNFSGTVSIEKVTGATTVESINGHIIFDAAARTANISLSTVNGNIEMRIPPDANLRWNAQTLRGDYRTTVPVRGRFDGTAFRGTINSPDGPVLTTASMTGNTYLLAHGTTPGAAQSLKQRTANASIKPPATPIAKTIQQAVIPGSFEFATTIGNISIGEIRGDARITTGAGEVQLGSVYGECQVISFGGPLNLGDISGPLVARTDAGDVLVQGARDGGLITTGGGTIRLLYNGGPTRLVSGGGDVIVRQAAGPIDAETRSGDVSVTVSPSLKTLRTTAKTADGNIKFIASPSFAADLDLTIVTDRPETHVIRSDFQGLSMTREQVGNKTRLRATGKVNGGGERVVLTVEQGSIYVNATTGVPVTLIEPRR